MERHVTNDSMDSNDEGKVGFLTGAAHPDEEMWLQAQENAVIINSPECLEPSALEAITKITYNEAQALLQVNERGVAQFFERKGCSHIGQALKKHGVIGSTLHMLTNANIERDLELSIGEQLALKAFLKRMMFVEKGSRRRDSIFIEPEFERKRQRIKQPGFCPGCCFCFKWLCCCRRDDDELDKDEIDVWELRPSRYGLTNDSLKLITSEWADGTSADTDRIIKTTPACMCSESCHCGPCCGYTTEDPPQTLTRTNNIDLKTLQDVDNFALSPVIKKHKPDCHEQCWGWRDTKIIYPAHVLVTYVDAGEIVVQDQEPPVKQATLRVDPQRAEEIAQQIIAGMQDAKVNT